MKAKACLCLHHRIAGQARVEKPFLHSLVPLLQAIYKKVDSDYSGTIDSHEMRNALREAGEYAARGHRRVTAVAPQTSEEQWSLWLWFGFASLPPPRSQHCQCHSPFLTVTYCHILLLLYTSKPILCSAL